MRRPWTGLAVLVLAASALTMRVAFAGSGISAPTELDLTTASCGTAHAHCSFFPLSGPGKGTVVRTSVPVLDADQNVVGRHRSACTIAAHASGVCTTVITLVDGPFTQKGTIVMSGLFDGTTPARFAVTGGTGAYAGVRGYATFDSDGTNYPTTLYLTP